MESNRAPGPWAQLVLETTLGLCRARSRSGAYNWTCDPCGTEPGSCSRTVSVEETAQVPRSRTGGGCGAEFRGTLTRSMKWGWWAAESLGLKHPAFLASSGPQQEAPHLHRTQQSRSPTRCSKTKKETKSYTLRKKGGVGGVRKRNYHSSHMMSLRISVSQNICNPCSTHIVPFHCTLVLWGRSYHIHFTEEEPRLSEGTE